MNTYLEHAIRERGGISEVRRRSFGHPTHFGIRLEWTPHDRRPIRLISVIEKSAGYW